MRTRTFWSAAAAVCSLGLLTAGSARAERSLLGITVGRSYRTVLAKYGTPDTMVPVVIPNGTAPQLNGQLSGGLGQPGFGGPGGPGDPGAAGGFPGGPGAPGLSGGGAFPGGAGAGGFPGGPGAPGLSGGGGFPGAGGPPVLPGAGGFPGGPGEAGMPGGAGGFPGAPGGFPGAPGGGGAGGFGGQQGGVSVGNAALWTYRKQGGLTYEFLINEDGLVAQISVSGRAANASLGKGAHLGSSYADVLRLYGFPETHLITTVGSVGLQPAATSYASVVKSGGQVIQVTYPKSEHIAFTFLSQKVVRMTVALAE